HECSNPLANTTRVRTETVLRYLNPFKPFKNWYKMAFVVRNKVFSFHDI
ncbi:MAG: hypothetical protein ACI91V_000735, partial [Lentimonas sp.]